MNLSETAKLNKAANELKDATEVSDEELEEIALKRLVFFLVMSFLPPITESLIDRTVSTLIGIISHNEYPGPGSNTQVQSFKFDISRFGPQFHTVYK